LFEPALSGHWPERASSATAPTGVLWPGSPAQQDRVTGARALAQHLAGRVKKPITAQQSISSPRQEIKQQRDNTTTKPLKKP
ncbi:MAG: hypothetical protein OZ927_20205, partial [Alcaligenaceae bacterium]|nr:hypothetical protein [Alcaligenaceae bacterium]